MDICPDHGIDGFKRYTAYAVLARNLQIVGSIEQKKRIRAAKRQEKAQRLLSIKRPIVSLNDRRESALSQVPDELKLAA